MKKIIAIALCLAMLLGCAAAVAETAEKQSLTIADKFTVKWLAPEGYEINVYANNEGDGNMIITLTPDENNAGKPMMTAAIAPNELYSEVQRMNDLSEEDMAAIEATFREEDEVEISYMETAYGTKLLVVKETKDGIDFVDFYTIYLGYEIELVLTQTEEMAGTSITDEQIATVIQFLSDMDLEPVAK